MRDAGEVSKLEWALQVGGDEIIRSAVEVACETGYPVADALQRIALQRNDPQLDNHIWELRHYGSNILASLQAEVGLRILHRAMAAGALPNEINELRTSCIVNLRMCGRDKEALPLAEAEVEFRRSMALSRPNHPSTELALAEALLLVKTSYLTNSEWGSAMNALQEALSIARRLYQAEPANGKCHFVYFHCLNDIATLMGQSHDPQTDDHFVKALAVGRALSAAHPDKYKYIYVSTLVYCADRVVDRQPDKALSLVAEAIDIYEDRVEGDPDRWNHRLATTLRDAALILLKVGEVNQALDNLGRADHIFRSLRQGAEESYRFDHAQTLGMKGVILGYGGRVESALYTLEEALNTLDASKNVSLYSAKLYLNLTSLAVKGGSIYDGVARFAAHAGLFHALHYANQTDHPARAIPLAAIPFLAEIAKPTLTRQFQSSVRKLTKAMTLHEISRTGGNVEQMLTETIQRKRSLIAPLIARCLEELPPPYL